MLSFFKKATRPSHAQGHAEHSSGHAHGGGCCGGGHDAGVDEEHRRDPDVPSDAPVAEDIHHTHA